MIIGDSLTSDIQGGINAGIRTIWFNPDGQQAADIHPDYEVKTLMEIPALLEKRDRRLTGPTMPPQGLYLNRVWYDGAAGAMMEKLP